MYFNCYDAIDFSIYQQAIYDIWTLKDPNPFISIRNVKIFNDHFDPILYLAVAFTALFGQGFQQLLVFEWLFYVAILLSPIYLFRNNLQKALPYLICILATRVLLYPFLLPIHPTTWSALPFFWLVYFIINKKENALLFMVLFLCLFKESYAFALFPLGLFYLFKKEFRLSLGILFTTLGFINFELFFKEEFLGPTVNYGSQIFEPLMTKGPVLFLKDIAKNFYAPPFVKMFYPFIFCFAFYANSLKKGKKYFPVQNFFAVSLFFTPLFLVQVWRNDIHLHYGAPFAGILLGLVVSLKIFHELPKKVLIFVVGLFVASSLGTYTKMFKVLFLNQSIYHQCSMNSDKIKQNLEVKKKMTSITKDKTILSTGGIIPFILLPEMNIHHYRGYSAKKNNYDYIILERDHSAQDIESVFLRCRPLASEIYIENHQLFFAQGNFQDCVYEKRELQKATPVE